MKTKYIDKEKIGRFSSKVIAWKLYKQSKKEDIVVALSKNLMNNEFLKNALKVHKIRILDGRWIIKFLLLDILEMEFRIKNLELGDNFVEAGFHPCPKNIEISNNLDKYRVAILMDKSDEIILEQIPEIAKRVKNLKIVTKNMSCYYNLEDKLFNEEGIAIQITNNKERSLLYEDIILNYDFNEEKLKEYNINSNAIIINLGENITLNKDDFCEKIINDFEICFDEEKYNTNIKKENFNKNILYESYIYKKDTYSNIKKQMQQDKVKISKMA